MTAMLGAGGKIVVKAPVWPEPSCLMRQGTAIYMRLQEAV